MAIFALLCLFVSIRAISSEYKLAGFYDFTVKDSNGENLDLGIFRGTVSLVTNVASECGYTDSHYKQLKQLQDEFESDGFQVIAFPCNQFGQQEPKTGKDVEHWAEATYHITFPILSKIAVSGENEEPAFRNLIEQSSEGPDWNFWKYLVDHEGYVVGAWGPNTQVQNIRDDVLTAIEIAKEAHVKQEL